MLMTRTERPQSPIQRELEGETAIVTGSTSGIGLGIAQALVRRGANVVLNGFGDAGEIEIVRAAMAAEHEVEVTYDSADLSKPDCIRRMVDAAGAHFGQVDILVNNAGIQHVAPIEEFPTERFELLLRVMLVAPFLAIKHAFPVMKRQRFGRIVNLASINGLVGFAGKSAYNSAKHGLVGLTRAAALEGAPHGITVNALCPGYVDTPLVRNQLADLARTRDVPLERVLGSPRHVRAHQNLRVPQQRVVRRGRLRVKHVDTRARQRTGVERLEQGRWVHEGGAADVDQNRSGFHAA